MVIATDTNFTVTTDGALPDGMAFDPGTSQVYGTPWTNGVFTFHVDVAGSNSPDVSKTYIFTIAKAGEVLPPHSSVDTSETPLHTGTTTGGVFTMERPPAVNAKPADGFAFVGWFENGTIVSPSARYDFTINLNRSLVARFAPMPPLSVADRQSRALSLVWPTNFAEFVLQEN